MIWEHAVTFPADVRLEIDSGAAFGVALVKSSTPTTFVNVPK